MTIPTVSSSQEARSAFNPQLVQTLGLFSSTTIVVGSMIGSGIFLVDADIGRATDSPALFLGAWLLTAVLTMIGALSYGELAAMMPKAGGQYVYLRESLGPLWGFLYGWTLFLVIQTGTMAAVAVGFGKFLGIFFPSISSTHWLWHIAHVPPVQLGPMVLGNMEIGVSTANLVGMVVLFVLAFLNIFGMKLGSLIQNVFTSAKGLSLAALVLLGFTVGRNPVAMAANYGTGLSAFWRNAGWGSLHPVQVGVGGPTVLVNLLVILAVVQVGSLFSADAWNNITFTAGEVKNPKRNIPLSLVLGTGFVLTVYFLASAAYMMVLPMHGDPQGATVLARGIQYAAEDRVGTATLEQIFGGVGASLMAGAILISTFGCANGMTFAGARVYYAMSRDGLFFKSVGKLHPKYQTPAAGLIVQACWAALLCISGSYGQLLDYIIFAVLVFYILTIVGLFVLRVKRPDEPRPYKALGYPVLPAIYIVIAAWICVVLLRYKPQYTWPGLVLCCWGFLYIYLWSRRSDQRPFSNLRPTAEEEVPSFMSRLFRIKPMSMLSQEAGEQGEHTLKRSLGALNLITLGIGAVIGAGIFTLTGQAAALHAGPAVALSFMLAGFTCAFAGLCYAEFASIIPIAGSAYTYGYATLGELVAWIIGWDLCLEYAFGAATVASDGRGTSTACCSKSGSVIPPALTTTTGNILVKYQGFWIEMIVVAAGVSDVGLPHVTGLFNLIAVMIVVVVTTILVVGHQGVGELQLRHRDHQGRDRGHFPGAGRLLPVSHTPR